MTIARPVLVVEDEDVIRETVCAVLEDEGLVVRAAGNGAEALEVTRTVWPSVVLLDMRMPVMDGWEFARAYRRAPGPHAPIVVCTAATDAAQRASDIGAAAYLAKPFTLDELVEVVARYTRQADERPD